MREFIYEVVFLSDIVLPATSNTQGNIEQLDFIAGSNFLGMVARNYKEFEDSFGLFHSGKVRFGDGHILHGGKESYKMPLSYFHKKADGKKIYNHHKLDPKIDFKSEENGGLGQLKQLRNGYITQDLETVFIDYTYTQKSAYNKKDRKSLDGSMFGYSAMRKGLQWRFSIKVDESIKPKDLELLKETIEGQKRLGKSKSAQYGLVNIRFIKEQVVEEQNAKSLKEVVIYAKSRIALVDKEGNPIYDLKYLCDGIEVDYTKSQIKTSTFTPYNGAMQTKTYERICINKGSVIVLNNVTKEQLAEIQKGVGAYLSEGFGEVLIDPSFLNKYSFPLIKKEKKKQEDKTVEIKSDLALFLNQREDAKQDKLNILNEVDIFILKHKSLYKNIKPSQWGKIRSICTSGDSDFQEQIEVYISNGVKAWEPKQIERLLEVSGSVEFIKLLSIQMPKQKDTKKEQKDGN